jgi:hypothetical protein
LALKWALGAMGQPESQNEYTKALGVSLGLSFVGFFLSSIWIIGGLLYLMVWVLVVMNVYEINFSKSLAVGVLQYILRWVLHLVLGAIGLTVGGTMFIV